MLDAANTRPPAQTDTVCTQQDPTSHSRSLSLSHCPLSAHLAGVVLQHERRLDHVGEPRHLHIAKPITLEEREHVLGCRRVGGLSVMWGDDEMGGMSADLVPSCKFWTNFGSNFGSKSLPGPTHRSWATWHGGMRVERFFECGVRKMCVAKIHWKSPGNFTIP